MIAPLYGIEKVARESALSAEARKELRNQHAPAMLELEPGRVGSPVLPKRQLGKAVRWDNGRHWCGISKMVTKRSIRT